MDTNMQDNKNNSTSTNNQSSESPNPLAVLDPSASEIAGDSKGGPETQELSEKDLANFQKNLHRYKLGS